MLLINFCGTAGKNTGGIKCDARFGNFRMAFVGGAKFTPAEYASEATLKAAILDRIHRDNSDAQKLYPWFVANNATNNTEEPTRETLGDGTQRTLREARPAYTIQNGFVGLNQEAALMEFNNTVFPVFVMDDTGKFIGKFDGANNLVGADAQLYTAPAGLGGYSAGTLTTTTVNYMDSRALSTAAMFFETSFSESDFNGLLDAEIARVAASVGNVHKLSAFVRNKSITKDVNLFDEYSDELADVDLWRGYAANGSLVTLTSVVADPTNRGFTLTFAAPVVRVDLAAPPVLYTNDVTGIEGVALAL
jgi:hypothetical protein